MALAFQCAGLSPIPVIHYNGTCQSGDVGVENMSNYSFGVGALETLNGRKNRVFGYYAGNRLTGLNNCIIGANAMVNFIGNDTVAIGAQAMKNTARAFKTTVVGYNACATGSNLGFTIAIGSNVSVGAYSRDVVVIGSVSVDSLINAVVIGSSIAPQTLFCNGIKSFAQGTGSWYTTPSSDKPIDSSGAWFNPNYVVADIKIKDF